MLLSLGLVVNVALSQFTFSPLSESRKDWNFIPYTPEQRIQVAQTMVNAFAIYVNRNAKIAYYGKERPDIDAIPRVQSLLSKAGSMTDKDFHYEMASIVASQRDGHLNYRLPAPHSCQSAFQAIRFNVANERDSPRTPEREKVVVSAMGRPEIVQLSPEASKIEIGDEVLKVDGLAIQDYIRSKLFERGGANQFGGMRNVLRQLAGFAGSFGPVPDKDQVSYEMKSLKSGKVYTVTLPWITRTNKVCFDKATTLTQQIKTGTVETSFADIPRKIPKMKFIEFKDPFSDFEEEAYGFKSEGLPLEIKDTEEKIVKYTIYKPESHNMGVIFLESFVPQSTSVEKTVMILRSLLTNELKDTNSVVIDIRSNGGGNIDLADSIPQLFGTNILPGGARAIVHPINQKIFLNSTEYPRDNWSEAYEKVKPGDLLTPIASFNTIETANTVGQVYVKPVGLLTNANCYSACDLLSAIVQDNEVGTIYGEDGSTGAGGANVVEINTFLNKNAPEYFPPFPYLAQLGEFTQAGRVAFRQSVRVKKNEGKIIEDFGIASDKVIRPTVADFFPNSTTYTQYERIAEDLNRQAVLSGKKFLYFRTVQDYTSEVEYGNGITFDLELQGMKRIVVNDAEDQEVATLSISPTELITRQNKKFNFEYKMEKTGNFKLKLLAFDAFGRQQVATIRYLSVLPNKKDYLELNSPGKINFNSKYVAVYDSAKTKVGNGWNLKDDMAVFGNGKQYENDSDSKLSIFINANKTFKINVDIVYQTEVDYDFLKIGYVKEGKSVQLLKSKNQEDGKEQDGVSGNGTVQQAFDIPVTGAVEVFIQFTADGGKTDVGATIKSLTIL